MWTIKVVIGTMAIRAVVRGFMWIMKMVRCAMLVVGEGPW